MATGNLSVSFEGGFIGTTGSNGQQIIDALTNTFAIWGVTGSRFEQPDDGTGLFHKEAQGNNVTGYLILTLQDGSEVSIYGEIDGLKKDGGKVELITFLAHPATPINITNGANSIQISDGVNIALDVFGSDFTVDQMTDADKDGSKDDIQGSADLQGALDELNAQLLAQVPTAIILENITVKENETYQYTATVSRSSKKAFSVTLSDGAVINFAAGATTGTSAIIPAQGDDVYKDEEVKPVAITSVSGGDYTFDISDTAEVRINDTLNPTKVTLSVSANSTTEGIPIEVSATVDHAPQGTNLVLTLNTGETITIEAGQTKGTALVNTREDNVYKEGSQPETISIQKAEGGNYEQLDISSQATVTVNDDEDITTVTVTTADVSEDDDSVSFNFELSNAPDTGVPASLTVDIGGTEYTVTLDADGKGSQSITTKDSDVYVDPSSLTATVKSINGGNFEDTDVTGATATADITDTLDVTNIELAASAPSIVIGQSVEITASVKDLVTGAPLVIELSNGNQITIAEGQSSGITTLTPDSVGTSQLSVTSATGGNFEALAFEGAATGFEVTNQPAQPEGLSHGYWKTHGPTAPGNQKNDWDPVTGGGGYDGAGGDSFEKLIWGSAQGVKWTWTQGAGKKATKVTRDDITLLEALSLTGSGANGLAREAVAAIFNARDEDVSYFMSESQIRTAVQNAFAGTGDYSISSLHTLLEQNNTLGVL